MEELVKDENVRRYMGIEARKRAVEKFGNIENVQKILDYIIQIVEKHKKANISIEKQLPRRYNSDKSDGLNFMDEYG